MGDYGDWNSRLRKAIDIADGISENSSSVDLQHLDNKQELNICTSTLSLLRSKFKRDKPSSQEVNFQQQSSSCFLKEKVLKFCSYFLFFRIRHLVVFLLALSINLGFYLIETSYAYSENQ